MTEQINSRGPADRSSHLKRWLTAIVALPLVFYAVAAAPLWFFFILITVVALIGTEELSRLLNYDAPFVIKASSHVLTVLFFFAIFLREVMVLPFLLFLWAMVPMTYLMFSRPVQDESLTAFIGRSLVAPLYIVLPIAMLGSIRMRPDGDSFVFFLLAVVVATDTGAFYFGRLLGRHRLYEKVSPKKTWEGAFGGTLLALVAAWIYVGFFPLFGHSRAVLLGFLMSVSGQVGDLVESMLKRCHSVKDSGRILPGHGGILDRIDSILFALPVLYLALIFL